MLTADPSKIRPNCFGPAGEASAPIPIDAKSLDVAENAAVKTTGFKAEWRDVVETQGFDETFGIEIGCLNSNGPKIGTFLGGGGAIL